MRYTQNTYSVPTVTESDETVLRRLSSIQDNYSDHFKDFVDWCRGEFSLGKIRDYFIFLNQDSGFAPGTIRIKRQAVKKRIKQLCSSLSFEERARIADMLQELDHTGETSAPKMQSEEIESHKYLSKAEVVEMLKKARSDRQKAFIRFLWVTGCRVSEMCGIKLKDVLREGDIYRIKVRGKGNKFRVLRISDVLYRFIVETFGGTTYLFETRSGKPYHRSYITHQIMKVSKSAIDKTVGSHALRHSFATWKVKKGVSIDAIANYLGHSSPSITLSMYSHNSMDNSELMDDDINTETL